MENYSNQLPQVVEKLSPALVGECEIQKD